jgi:hypothetical protein
MSETDEKLVEYLNKLKDTTNHENIISIVEKLLPEWIDGVADKYADEYGELNKTWNDLCNKVNAEKAKIIIVKYLPMNTKTSSDQFIATVADMLVSKGYFF